MATFLSSLIVFPPSVWQVEAMPLLINRGQKLITNKTKDFLFFFILSMLIVRLRVYLMWFPTKFSTSNESCKLTNISLQIDFSIKRLMAFRYLIPHSLFSFLYFSFLPNLSSEKFFLISFNPPLPHLPPPPGIWSGGYFRIWSIDTLLFRFKRPRHHTPRSQGWNDRVGIWLCGACPPPTPSPSPSLSSPFAPQA